MQWHIYLLIIAVLGVVFFAAALIALFWSAKRGHLTNFELQSKSIFDDDEPEGEHTDFFPGEKSKARQKITNR